MHESGPTDSGNSVSHIRLTLQEFFENTFGVQDSLPQAQCDAVSGPLFLIQGHHVQTQKNGFSLQIYASTLASAQHECVPVRPYRYFHPLAKFSALFSRWRGVPVLDAGIRGRCGEESQVKTTSGLADKALLPQIGQKLVSAPKNRSWNAR